MTVQAKLELNDLKSLVDYDPVTGLFSRKYFAINPRAQAAVGCTATNGYYQIKVRSVRYLAHRLAWFYIHGVWPKELDHINGDKMDNRIENLREATRSQNMANGPKQRNNTSGVKGVCFDKTNKKWLAYLMVNKKFQNLGRFDSFDDAVSARAIASRKAFGEFARI